MIASEKAGMQAAGQMGTGAAMPIWFAALIGAHCEALVNGQPRTVRWNCVSGQAQYTNFGTDAEVIQPLGVLLQGALIALFVSNHWAG